MKLSLLKSQIPVSAILVLVISAKTSRHRIFNDFHWNTKTHRNPAIIPPKLKELEKSIVSAIVNINYLCRIGENRQNPAKTQSQKPMILEYFKKWQEVTENTALRNEISPCIKRIQGVFQGILKPAKTYPKLNAKTPPKLSETVFWMVLELWWVLEGYGAFNQNSGNE